MTRHVVAKVGDIPPSSSKIVSVDGRDIGIFNVKGEFFALLNRCPHEGAELCRGSIVSFVTADTVGEYRLERKGEMLRCPWHGWEFDIRTGQSWCDPKKVKARSYPVTVRPGQDLVKDLAEGPYKVETFPVSVQDDYLVVEI
jgi:3-phenylpropionate/trans-cinnamate dioxygenase ferredoxin subunit